MAVAPDAHEAGERIEQLLGQLREGVSAPVQAQVEELVRLLLELHGRGLGRAMELLDERGRRALADDALVASLLILHDLHPDDVHTRIQRALDRVRPYLGSHAGGVQFVGVDGAGVAHLKLEGSCDGCPSSTVTVKLALEQAVLDAAPEVERIEVEGVVPARQTPSGQAGAWRTLSGAEALPDGGLSTQVIDGAQVLVCRARGTLFAFRDACARCGSGLERGVLDGDTLVCPACHQRFDVRRAGRALEGHDRHLYPLPLVVEAGGARVALPEART
jgi:Fe-S cluster biogenesis protein NfuA/nitrite reductase/ring-hydroxylating ferredoxin subunit